MDFSNLIQKRKSIRKYLPDKKISKGDVQKILEAVNLAPSAHNWQSYKIFAVQNKETINQLSIACYNQKDDFIKNAALVLVFCTNPSKTEDREKNLYSLQDATIAATYATLAATSLGYVSCWVGTFDENEMQKILNTDLRPVAAIILGYSDDDPARPARKLLENLVKFI